MVVNKQDQHFNRTTPPPTTVFKFFVQLQLDEPIGLFYSSKIKKKGKRRQNKLELIKPKAQNNINNITKKTNSFAKNKEKLKF